MTIGDVGRINHSVTVTEAIYDRLEEAMQAVEQVMYAVVDSQVTVLRDASRHILQAGGKRIRPRILMLAYMLVGGEDFPYAAPVGAAVELMHTASVVHDDINDHGILRRGRPSVNAVWGRTFALLTGDFLFTKVYELMAPYKDMNIDLAAAASALVEGETLQATAVKENVFTREVYARIIALKTAALFQYAGILGAKLANATPEQIHALGQYAYHVGLAFQIVDDILDIVGDEVKLGKTAGIDIVQGRGVAVAFNNENGSTTPNPSEIMDSIKRKLLKGDALEEAKEQARQLINLAEDTLNLFPDHPAKQALVSLARQVVDRDF